MRILIPVCLLFVLAGCQKGISVSDCIDSKIESFKTQGLCSNAFVKEYLFQGKLVYVFSVGNCPDAGEAVYDADCNFLGTLGGFIANSQAFSLDFEANAQYKRTIWHN